MRWMPLVLVLVAACGGSSGSTSTLPPSDPQLDFDLGNDGRWRSAPVASDLDDVSNNGTGYTGDIDRYELVVPADGRLVVELTWEADSDLDFILAEDPQAESRLLESTGIDFDPEYESIDVVAGQVIYIFVAGWRGDAADYTLETIVLSVRGTHVRHRGDAGLRGVASEQPSVAFPLQRPLDPEQELDGRAFLIREGILVDGTWCIEEHELVFYPRLPLLPGQEGGLVAGRFVPGLAAARRARAARDDR